MEPGLVLAIVATAVAAAALYFAWTKRGAGPDETMHSELGDLRAELDETRTRATEAETRLDEARRQIELTARERDELRESEKDLRTTAEARKVEIDLLNEKLKDWEAAREQFMTGANKALVDTAAKVSNKLLEDHKREAKAEKEESEKRVKQATEQLFKQFEAVSNSVASLTDRVGRNDDAVDTIHRALSSPGGAGQFAEIGLENSLKSFGLRPDRDFFVQQTLDGVDGGKVRPDAVVFLPFDSVLVVDCKASKFLLDLAAAEDEAAVQEARENLKRTMREHLRSLAGKAYLGAVQAEYRKAGRASELRRVLNVMYLPNEGAVEKVAEIDSTFVHEAAERGITIVGPTGLLAMIAFARVEIDLGQQAENQEHIIDATRVLLDRVATMLGHAGDVGKGLRAAVKSYVDWSKSVNARLLPATQALETLGVRVEGKKKLERLPLYEFIDTEQEPVIQGEAAELPLPEPTPKLGED